MLEKATAKKAPSAKHSETGDAVKDSKAKADKALGNTSLLSTEERKGLESAAVDAGINPGRATEMSDRELQKFVRELPAAQKALNAPEAKAVPMDPNAIQRAKELQENEAIKARLEAEKQVARASSAHSSAATGNSAENRALKATIEAQEATSAKTAPVSAWVPSETEDFVSPVSVEDTRVPALKAIQARMDEGTPVTSSEKDYYYRYIEDYPEITSPRSGSLDNIGGPDAGGYRFVDNASPDTATYEWIELRGNGETYINDISNHDDGYSAARYPIGFPFRFYGVQQDSFRVAGNGFVQFTTSSGNLTNNGLPNTDPAGPAIFLYHDDLHLDRNGQTTNQIMYRNFGTYTVIEYDSIGVYASTCGAGGLTNTLKFQVILFNDGKIKVQYNTVNVCDGGDSSMTVGIQAAGAAGSAALRYCYGTGGQTLVGPLPVAGRAIWFMPTEYVNDFATTAITSPAANMVYGADQVLAVTATFLNIGSLEQSVPVKYSFNGGATVEEATASIAQWATAPHTFTTSITTPSVSGSYPLTLWCDLAADENRSNDTLRRTVQVFVGGSCASTIPIVGMGPDSATFNNCGAGDNSPGVPCYSTSYNDMVFEKTVPSGSTVTFWVSSFAWVSKYLDITARWGGSCPGTNVVDCFTASGTPNLNKRLTWTNSTGATQTIFLTVGNYSYYTANYCGNFKLAWQEQICAAVDAPYTQGFETVPHVPVLPNCVTQENGNGVSPVWESYGTNSRTGTKNASISSVAAGNNDWLFMPAINMEEGRDYFLSYWRRVGSASYPDSLEVRAGLAPTADAMTISVAAMDSCKRTVYIQKLGGFTAPTSEAYYIGFHSVSRTSSARTYIDDINIDASDVCSTGTVTVSTVTGQDSATLVASLGAGWYGGVPRYQWFTGETCDAGNEIAGATSSSYQTYTSGTFACRVNILDCIACASGVATVINCSIGQVPPWSENFDAVTTPALPLCWSQLNVNADPQQWVTSTSYEPRSLPNQGYIRYSASGVVNDDWLFSAPVQLTEGVPYLLDYYYKMAWTTVSYLERLEVSIGSAPNPAAMTTVLHAAWDFNNITYVEDALSFTPTTTGTYWIGWHCLSGDDEAGIGIDDISLYADTACVAPTSVTVNDVAGIGSARLQANFIGGQGTPAFQWYTGNGIAPANEIVGATADTLVVTASGWYSCKVWRGDDPVGCMLWDSAYAEVIDCGIASTVPWNQNFDGVTVPAFPPCWTQQDVNADETVWKTSTNYPRSAPNCGWISYDWENASNDWMYSRAFTAELGDTLVIEYWYRMAWSSASYTERMEVFAGTTPEAASMTTLIDAAFDFSNIVYDLHAPLFVVPATGTYYLGWHAISIANQGGISVDDIRVYPYGDCGAPTTVDVPAVATQDQVTLTCSVTGGFGGPISYQWYTGESCVAGNEIAGATSNQYQTLTTGVFSCKAWFVDPVACSGCDSALATVLPDPCLPGSLPPVIENFDGVTTPALPDCWSQEDGNADTYVWHTSTSYANTLPNSVSTVHSPSEDWIFTRPVVLAEAQTVIFSFGYRAESSSYPQTAMAGVGLARNNAAMADTLVQPWTFTNTTYATASASYTAPAAGSYYFGVKNISVASGYWTYMDDFMVIRPGVDCAAPTTVTVASVTAPDTVTLTCSVSGGYGSALQYQWYTGGSCATGFEILGATGATYTTTVSGDYSCVAYYCGNATTYGACGAGTATVQACVANPYNGWPTMFVEGFEGVTTPTLPDCWRQLDGNADNNKWVTTTSNPRTGLNAAYMYYGGTTALNDWLFSEPLHLTEGETMVVDYWYRAYFTATGESQTLEVMAGLAPVPGAMLETVQGAFNFTTTTYANGLGELVVPATGDYYIGFHDISATGMNGTFLDDIKVYRSDYCEAPTVNVPALAYPGAVTLIATATGGAGLGATQYQWFTGETCAAGNEIAGATTSQYTTTVSGIFSCKASRGTCSVCDSAYADVMIPQAGELCSNAMTLTPPVVGTPTVVTGTTVGFYSQVPSLCGADLSNGPDLYYTLTLTGQPARDCRRITMVLEGGDMHLAIYQSTTNCETNVPYLCNDDLAQFAPLPGWDVTAQHPASGTASYIAAELEPGTYLIRVGYYGSASGSYTLTVYDNGLCNEPCDAATGLTVYISSTNPSQMWWHFNAPSQGTYRIFTTTAKNNDGDPNNGLDTQWSLDTTLEVLAAGVVECVDLDGGPVANGYENYAVVHDCPVYGRCCYGDFAAPTCENNTQDECTALNGSWNRWLRCETTPCPIVALGENCYAPIALSGTLPISVTGTTTGYVDDCNMVGWTEPACWQVDAWSENDASGEDVFYHYIAPAAGTYSFNICTSSYDASLLLFNYTCPTPPSPASFICGNDDNSTACPAHGTGAQISAIALTEGQHVLIVVDGYSTNDGTYTLVVSQP